MRTLMLAALVSVGLYGPASAFDFTPRSFRVLYDAHLRLSGTHEKDLCGSASRDYSCDYGDEKKDPIASISNLDAKSDHANSASLSWSPTLTFKTHVDQLRAFVAICAPRADEVRRGILVGRLLDQGQHPTPQGLSRGYVLDGVRYALTMQADGAIMVEADDLRMPAPIDLKDGWGATDEIK